MGFSKKYIYGSPDHETTQPKGGSPTPFESPEPPATAAKRQDEGALPFDGRIAHEISIG
jgi:hypothetical protein